MIIQIYLLGHFKDKHYLSYTQNESWNFCIKGIKVHVVHLFVCTQDTALLPPPMQHNGSHARFRSESITLDCHVLSRRQD